MPWFIVLWLAWLAFGAVVVINSVGKQRKPLTPNQASCAVIVIALQAWAIVTVSS